MKNPCGMTQANIIERTEVNGMKVVFGSGVNPVNSPAQFFVAWGKDILANGLIHTYNCETPESGFLWFIDEDQAEAKYRSFTSSLHCNTSSIELKCRTAQPAVRHHKKNGRSAACKPHRTGFPQIFMSFPNR